MRKIVDARSPFGLIFPQLQNPAIQENDGIFFWEKDLGWAIAPHVFSEEPTLQSDRPAARMNSSVQQGDSVSVDDLSERTSGDNSLSADNLPLAYSFSIEGSDLSSALSNLFVQSPGATPDSQEEAQAVAEDGLPDGEFMNFGFIRTLNDTLYVNQWHLAVNNGDINIGSVWSNYTGKGVKIGVIDDGFNYTHRDLIKNYRQDLDRDFVRRDNDASALAFNENHGTAVMGVIGAEANNGHGVVGVAHGASLVGYQISFGSQTLPQIELAMQQARTLDVVNNSWGFSGFFGDNFQTATFSRVAQHIQDAAYFGRGGLGTNIIFAAGNEGNVGQNTNYHDFQNSPFVITVGATDINGQVASFSTPGASVLLSAPGTGIVTTDRTGTLGYSTTDFVGVSGTSFAAPVVAGVVGLMLEANSRLGYRDVQEILAYSAQKTVGMNGAAVNGASDWNGGGLTFKNAMGFGVVDAHAAVRLAESWSTVSTASNMATVSKSASAGLGIRDGSTGTSTINISNANMEIDRVEINLDITHGRIGDLVVSLISPSGTESFLMERAGVHAGNANGVVGTGLRFTMDSNQFWGESPNGNWTLKVTDARSGFTGNLNSWGLTFIGDANPVNDVYVYTEDFAKMYDMNPIRGVLNDLDGGTDTMNLSAIRSAVSINLNAGNTSKIMGKDVQIGRTTQIERVYSGDGDDLLIGNAVSNVIAGGRGKDMLYGGGGADTFLFGHVAHAGDRVFDFGVDDMVDVRGVLSSVGYTRGMQAFADKVLMRMTSESGTSLFVDDNGLMAGTNWVEVAHLQGYFGNVGIIA